MKGSHFFRPPVGMAFVLLCCSCATRPFPAEEPLPLPVVAESTPVPTAQLSFDHIEARDIKRLTLWFTLEAENPLAEAASVSVGDWRATLNGLDTAGGGTFTLDGGSLLPGERGTFPVRLDLDLGRLLPDPPDSSDLYDGEADLQIDLLFTYVSGETVVIPLRAEAAFPLIREPEFTITAIAVKKADLINTQFKVSLRIDNPNSFPVELLALSYELYGSGRFWAGGSKTNVFTIPARDSAETDLLLTMNFIDMSRELLDQIISMRQISYRFAGDATIGAGIDYLPEFRMRFDRSGNSAVVE